MTPDERKTLLDAYRILVRERLDERRRARRGLLVFQRKLQGWLREWRARGRELKNVFRGEVSNYHPGMGRARVARRGQGGVDRFLKG